MAVTRERRKQIGGLFWRELIGFSNWIWDMEEREKPKMTPPLAWMIGVDADSFAQE